MMRAYGAAGGAPGGMPNMPGGAGAPGAGGDDGPSVEEVEFVFSVSSLPLVQSVLTDLPSQLNDSAPSHLASDLCSHAFLFPPPTLKGVQSSAFPLFRSPRLQYCMPQLCNFDRVLARMLARTCRESGREVERS